MAKGRKVYGSLEAVGPQIPRDLGERNDKDRTVREDAITHLKFHQLEKRQLQRMVYASGSPVLPYAPVVGIPTTVTSHDARDRRDHSREVDILGEGDTLTREQVSSLLGTLIAHALIFDDTDHTLFIERVDADSVTIIDSQNIGADNDQLVLFDFEMASKPYLRRMSRRQLLEDWDFYLLDLELSMKISVKKREIRDVRTKVVALRDYYAGPLGQEKFNEVLRRGKERSGPYATLYDTFMQNMQSVIGLLNDKLR